jgi:hypothetical protein
MVEEEVDTMVALPSTLHAANINKITKHTKTKGTKLLLYSARKTAVPRKNLAGTDSQRR